MISEKIGAWRRRIDLFALEREGDGDGGFIGLSIANLSASVRYRTILNYSSRANRSVYIFPKRPTHNRRCGIIPSIVRAQVRALARRHRTRNLYLPLRPDLLCY